MNPVPSAVVIGCGYVGTRLQHRLSAQGVSCIGVARTALADNSRLLLDLDQDDQQPLLQVCAGASLYYFAPPSSNSLHDARSRRLIDTLQQAGVLPANVVLISTTGVYGDCAGGWVDESAALRPAADRAKRRVDAEQAWAQFSESTGVALAVLRVAGIYGPGKLPLRRLHSGKPLLSQQQSPWSNRVHVDDLLDTVQAVSGSATVINVADGNPSSMTQYFHCLADAAGLPRLPEASREQLQAQWSEGLRSYMDESRRIDNSHMRELLGASLRYPDLATGLAACFDEA